MGGGSSKPSDSAVVAAPAKSTGSGKTPGDFKRVHSAVRWNKPTDEIAGLLSSKEDVNCSDDRNGNQPIHIAAQNGHYDIIGLLLTKGADVNAVNGKGNTPLHMAIEYDYYDSAMRLIEAGAKRDVLNAAGSRFCCV